MRLFRSKFSFLLITFFLGSFSLSAYSQVSYTTKTAQINLFSSTPFEDIAAQSKSGLSVFIPKMKQILFKLPIKSLAFQRPLMQEHFNENYMESDKYPDALFKGTFTEEIDFTQDGNYSVSVKGLLTIHNVTKERIISGVISVKKGIPTITSTFDVLCEDHQIKIPSVVFQKIAEKIKITVKANYN
jgi:hypothetical protein